MQFTINSFRKLFPDNSLIFNKMPDISLTAVKFPDISRFSRQMDIVPTTSKCVISSPTHCHPFVTADRAILKVSHCNNVL